MLVPHRKKTGDQQAYVKVITRTSSHPKNLFTDFGGEICSDEFDRLIMADKNITSRFWDFVADHCVLLNAVTSPAVDEPTNLRPASRL